jgi:site-specific recombinase XerD
MPTTEITTTTAPAETALSELRSLADDAASYAVASKAKSTRRAYRKDWAAFCAWCASHALESLPARPEAVATYASYMVREGLGVSSVARAMAAVSQAHQMAGHESPTKTAPVRETIRGIRRTLGVAPDQKAAATLVELRAMVGTTVATAMGVRDRALLLVGFSGAFRRSELVALDVADLDFSERGVLVTVRRSKTDQEGEGMVKAIPFALDAEMCPVLALRTWLEATGISAGAVFRTVDRWGHVSGRMSDRGVARAVQRAARLAGLDATRFAGHSLRAGFATSAILAGRDEADVMRQTGHRSVAVFRGYVRVADAWRKNAATGLL